MMKKICENCGFESEGNFCPQCGGKLMSITEGDSTLENNVGNILSKDTETSIQSEKPKKKGCLVATIIAVSVVIILLVLFIIGAIVGQVTDDSVSENVSSNLVDDNAHEEKEEVIIEEEKDKKEETKFGLLNGDNATLVNYTDEQKLAMVYNSKDISIPYDSEFFARNPKKLEGVMISAYVQIYQIITNSDTEFECLVGTPSWEVGVEPFYMIMKSEQFHTRLLEGDYFTLYGEFVGMSENAIEINGQGMFLPEITADVSRTGNEYVELEDINTIATTILGENVQLAHSTENEGYEGVFNNLSNSKLQGIFMPSIPGVYYRFLSSMNIVDGIGNGSSVLPSADFEYFYQFEHENLTNKVSQINCYDHELNTIWSKVMSENSSLYCNYTDKVIYLSVANKLYMVDVSTGEDLMEPIHTGVVGDIYIDTDTLFIQNNNALAIKTDALIAMDYDGEIEWRMSLPEETGYTKILKVDEDSILLATYETEQYSEWSTIVGLQKVYEIDKNTGEILEILDCRI